jgi:excisionase family DNA binding protein
MEKLFFTAFTEEEFRQMIKICLKEEIGKIKIMPESHKYPMAHLSVKDMTILMGVSKVTIGQWVKKGILKAYKVGNKRVYFKREEVEDLLKKEDVPIKHIVRFEKARQDFDNQVWMQAKKEEKREKMIFNQVKDSVAEEERWLASKQGKKLE